jgi:hypothetical protein
MRAFAIAGSRQAILDQLDGPELRLTDDYLNPVPDAITEVAAKTGISQALLYVAVVISEDDPTFLRTLMVATPDGAETLASVRRWAMRILSDAMPMIEDEATRTAAQAVVTLHKRTLTGQPVTKQEWRAARAALPVSSDDASGLACSVVAASAWDFEQSPGAAADLVIAWRDRVLAFADVEIAWRPEEDELLEKYHDAFNDYIVAEIGEAKFDDDGFPESDYSEKFQSASESFSRDNPTNLMRSQEINDRWVAGMREQGRQMLLDELRLECALKGA